MREGLPDVHVTRSCQEPFLNLLTRILHSCHLRGKTRWEGGAHSRVLSLSIRPSSFLSTTDLPWSRLLSKLSVTPLKRLSQVQQGSNSYWVLKGKFSLANDFEIL